MKQFVITRTRKDLVAEFEEQLRDKVKEWKQYVARVFNTREETVTVSVICFGWKINSYNNSECDILEFELRVVDNHHSGSEINGKPWSDSRISIGISLPKGSKLNPERGKNWFGIGYPLMPTPPEVELILPFGEKLGTIQEIFAKWIPFDSQVKLG